MKEELNENWRKESKEGWGRQRGARKTRRSRNCPHVLENRDFQSGHLFLVLKEWNINIVATLVRHHKNTIPPSKKESDIRGLSESRQVHMLVPPNLDLHPFGAFRRTHLLFHPHRASTQAMEQTPKITWPMP
jgi:hypothetical protein